MGTNLEPYAVYLRRGVGLNVAVFIFFGSLCADPVGPVIVMLILIISHNFWTGPMHQTP